MLHTVQDLRHRVCHDLLHNDLLPTCDKSWDKKDATPQHDNLSEDVADASNQPHSKVDRIEKSDCLARFTRVWPATARRHQHVEDQVDQVHQAHLQRSTCSGTRAAAMMPDRGWSRGLHVSTPKITHVLRDSQGAPPPALTRMSEAAASSLTRAHMINTDNKHLGQRCKQFKQVAEA